MVDAQNAGDVAYQRMTAGRFNQSAAYPAACDLVFKGLGQQRPYRAVESEGSGLITQ